MIFEEVKKVDKLTFKKGLRDGVPIALGYFSVSAAFGMICVNNGLPMWAAPLISLTNFTGTGQFVGASLIATCTSVIAIILTLLVINARYFLMSISLSQRLSSKITLLGRLAIAFGNTDEIFAVAMQQNQVLNIRYMYGLILCSFAGWLGGTVTGTLVGSIMPIDLVSAMGIAIYAMFIAIIVPPLKKSKPIFVVVAIAAVLNCILTYTPALSSFGSSWGVIISGIVAAAVGAIAFPQEMEGFDE